MRATSFFAIIPQRGANFQPEFFAAGEPAVRKRSTLRQTAARQDKAQSRRGPARPRAGHAAVLRKSNRADEAPPSARGSWPENGRKARPSPSEGRRRPPRRGRRAAECRWKAQARRQASASASRFGSRAVSPAARSTASIDEKKTMSPLTCSRAAQLPCTASGSREERTASPGVPSAGQPEEQSRAGEGPSSGRKVHAGRRGSAHGARLRARQLR